jgi:hypothetical protein
LVEIARREKDVEAFKAKQNINEKIIQDWKDAQKKEVEAKRIFRASVIERVSVIKAIMDDEEAGQLARQKTKNLEESRRIVKPVEPVVNAKTEEAAIVEEEVGQEEPAAETEGETPPEDGPATE